MGERLSPSESEQNRYSRRELFRKSRKVVLGSTAAALAYKLVDGVSLNDPALRPYTVTINREISPDKQPLAEDVSAKNTESAVVLTPDGKLLFEPSGEFFTPDKKFIYVHRGGNSIENIQKGYDKGANLFDIDANDVQGMVYGEHGIIPNFEVKLKGLVARFRIPLVIDANEKEFKLGMPHYTYEELINFLGLLSTPDRRLAASVELKRGSFEPNTLSKMFDIHKRFNVPAIIQTTNPNQFSFTNKVT